MDTEKLKLIDSLIAEGKAFQSHVDSMEAECKSIKQYCLDAIQDFHDTFCAVSERIEKNPQIGQVLPNGNRYFEASHGVNGLTCFYYCTDNTNCGKYIDNIKDNGYLMRGLMGLAQGLLTEDLILRVKQKVEREPVRNIKRWEFWKRHADITRNMSAVLLECVRVAAEEYRNEQKELMGKCISAGAKTYEKVI